MALQHTDCVFCYDDYMSHVPRTSSGDALDERWYARLEALCFEDYEKLTGTREHRDAQKDAFFRDEMRNPTLDYPELEHFDIEGREARLLELKADIEATEEYEVVVELYRLKINEMIAGLRMLRGTREGDDHTFSKYAELIYGTPDPENASYVATAIEGQIAERASDDEPAIQASVERLTEILEKCERTTDSKVKKDVLPNGEDIDGMVESAAEAAKAFQDALRQAGIDDWNVVVDTKRGVQNFSVSQEHKEVRIPSDEALKTRKMTRQKLKGLIAHEVGTHIVRRHHGERSILKLLGLGFDRYLVGEEGIAAYNEQQVTGAEEFTGLVRYFSIMAAKGFDGTPRDFRDTFSVMHDYFLLGMDAPLGWHRAAADSAWEYCVRTFRGTTCATPGAVFPKDLVYFSNRDIWTLVSRHAHAPARFALGKFDPNNHEHVTMLKELGILDVDLRA